MEVPAEGNGDSVEAQIPAVNRTAGAARHKDTVVLQGGEREAEAFSTVTALPAACSSQP